MLKVAHHFVCVAGVKSVKWIRIVVAKNTTSCFSFSVQNMGTALAFTSYATKAGGCVQVMITADAGADRTCANTVAGCVRPALRVLRKVAVSPVLRLHVSAG
jgi:hypothetical protein